jgi:hypothetical protein
MKQIRLFVYLITIGTVLFCEPSFSQTKKQYQDDYTIKAVTGGVDIYARWRLTCDWCTDVVDMKIVNNNNYDIWLSYEVIFLYQGQVVFSRGQAALWRAGQTQQPAADWSGAGLTWTPPQGYPVDGTRGVLFNVRNIKVKRYGSKSDEEGTSAGVQNDREDQTRAAADAESKRQAEERRREEQQKRDELARRAQEQQEREEQSKTYQDKLVGTTKDFANLAMNRPSDQFLGATWKIAFGLGAGYIAIPVIQNMSGSSINSYSSVTTGGGVDFELALEAWPYYSKYVDVSAFADADLATGPGMGGTNLCYGAHATLGIQYFRAVGEFSLGTRSASSTHDQSSDGVDASGGGSGNYAFKRIGYGLRLYTSSMTERLPVYLEVMLLTDMPDIPDVEKIIVYQVTLNASMLGIKVEYSKDYPGIGTASFTLDSKTNNYIKVTMFYNLNALGDPYFK